jgi:hypothetical protein
LVGTDDIVFHYLNEGTSVRKATMTSDFTPKTQPGRLLSRGGSGGKSFVSNDPRHWHPGIQPREWTLRLMERYQSDKTLANIARDVFNRLKDKLFSLS